MTEGEPAGSRLVLAGVALAATVLLVAGVSLLGSSSPWADSLDTDYSLDSSPAYTDLSTGRIGALADSNRDDDTNLETRDRGDVGEEQVEDDLERTVRESVDDLDEQTVDEATGSGDGSGAGGSQEAKDEAVQQAEEDLEDEMQEEVDEDTLQTLVEQALEDRAQEEQDGELVDGGGSSGGEADSSASDGGNQTSEEQQGDTTADGSSNQTSQDEASATSTPEEGSGPPGGELPAPGVVPAIAVLAAVLALLVVAYRRDALSLEAVRNLPRTMSAKATAAAYTAAELASEAITRIRNASTPFDAFHAVVALLQRRLQSALATERSTEDMASEIAEGGDADGGSAGSARQLVMESWGVLTRASGLESPDRRTPGQVARAAVARGLPAEPVRRVTDAFREIEYGDGDAEALAEDVRSAMKEIRDAAGGG